MTMIQQLEYAYGKVRHEEDFEGARKVLVDYIKIDGLINYLLYAVEEYHEEDRAMTRLLIMILQEMYNNDGETPIPDETYDKLYELNRQINQEEIVGASVGARDKQIGTHSYPDLRGTLDKVHFVRNDEKRPNEKRRSLEDWMNSILNKVKRRVHTFQAYMFPKWDGLSVIFECDEKGRVVKVLTRGDTELNEAIDLSKMFKGINMLYAVESYDPNTKKKPFGVKTEIVMTRVDYDALCKKYGHFKSPRSAVSSILNSKELEQKYLPFLTIVPLRVQFQGGEELMASTAFEFPYHEVDLLDTDQVRKNIKDLANAVEEKYGIDIDGIVIRLTDKQLKEELGRENHINKYEAAFKLPPLQKKTILKDIEMSVGVLGAVTPVAKVEPVKLKGNTISSISLGSIDRFESLQLRQGDEVVIKYDIIPYLDKADDYIPSQGNLFTSPTHCPYCQEKLEKAPVLRCVNISCDSRIIGKILNYVNKMSIPNISEGTITTFYKHGFLTSIEDLYRLKDHQRSIIQMNGFGEKSFQKIIDGIQSRKEVYDYELIGSLGIPDIGRKMFKRILDVYPLDDLLKICHNGEVDKLTIIAGIKEKTAKKVIVGVLMNFELLKFLRSELKTKQDNRKYTIKVAFTKVRDKEFEKYLDSKDILVMDSYKKEVDMLIVPDYQTESSKVKKAQKDGKDIVSIEDAYKMFEYTAQ